MIRIKNAYNKKKNFLVLKKVILNAKKNRPQTYMWEAALCRNESWNFDARDKKKIQTIEAWSYKRFYIYM